MDITMGSRSTSTTTSTRTRSNQFRLWIASVAYLLVHELRRVGLHGTELARAQAGTIRTRLLKVGGLIRVSIRRVVIAVSSVFPLRRLFAGGAGQCAIKSWTTS